MSLVNMIKTKTIAYRFWAIYITVFSTLMGFGGLSLLGQSQSSELFKSTGDYVQGVYKTNLETRNKLDAISRLFISISTSSAEMAMKSIGQLGDLDKALKESLAQTKIKHSKYAELHDEILSKYTLAYAQGNDASIAFVSDETEKATKGFANANKLFDDIKVTLNKINDRARNTAAVKFASFLDTQFYIISFGLAGVLIFIGLMIFFIQKITISQLSHISTESLNAAKNNLKISSDLNDELGIVSSNLTGQSAAVDETVSTLDEINATLNTSAKNSEESAKRASESLNVSSDGQTAVQEVISSLDSIEASNESMIAFIESNETKMNHVLTVIKEVEAKTQVINDIVFQTKLLSFNASVESARAGEHGKGFAVVAEEIGTLAQQSGTASSEIKTIINESITSVEKIISDTKIETEKITIEGKQKVSEGIRLANSCGEILGTVVTNVGEVNGLMDGISEAAKEQALGVDNISVAMRTIDDDLRTNAKAIKSSEEVVSRLNTQANELEGLVVELNKLVAKDDDSNAAMTSAKENSPQTTENFKLAEDEVTKPEESIAS